MLLFLRVCLGWNQRQEDVCYLGTACQADSRKAILWARIHAPARQSLHHHLLQRLLPRRFARMRIKREDIFSRSSTLRLRLAYRVRCEHLSPSSRLQPQELSKAHRHRQYSIGLPLNLLSFSLTCIEHHSGTRKRLGFASKGQAVSDFCRESYCTKFSSPRDHEEPIYIISTTHSTFVGQQVQKSLYPGFTRSWNDLTSSSYVTG